MTRALDSWISTMALQLEALPRRSFALFFAFMAERLMPLYEAFENRHGWGYSSALRSELDSVWSVVSRAGGIIVSTTPQRLEAMLPSGEDFDSPDSTYAQDVVVCVDAAARALIPDEPIDGRWVEYALEPIKTRASIYNTGYSAIEGDKADDWESDLIKVPEVATFMQDCEELLVRIRTSGGVLNTEELRAEARSKNVEAYQYIP